MYSSIFTISPMQLRKQRPTLTYLNSLVGSNCGVNVDDCASQPCHFGGKCQDQENGFFCLCSPGYEGEICDQGNLVKLYYNESKIAINWVFNHLYTCKYS